MCEVTITSIVVTFRNPGVANSALFKINPLSARENAAACELVVLLVVAGPADAIFQEHARAKQGMRTLPPSLCQPPEMCEEREM